MFYVNIKQSDRYIISDTHLGHDNISNFRHILWSNDINDQRKLLSSEEHHELVYEGLMQVPKRATLFLLGDIAFTAEWREKIKALPCRNKILLCGNHDLDVGKVSMKDLTDTYEKVYALYKYKGYWLQHCPAHPQELRGKRCVHGHTHYHLMLNELREPDKGYVNVCCEYTGYKPIPWEYAISDEYFQECCSKWRDSFETK